MAKLTMQHGKVMVANYKTNYSNESGLTSETISGSVGSNFIANTSPQEIKAIKLATFNHTCKRCKVQEPRQDCNANEPPVEKIFDEVAASAGV